MSIMFNEICINEEMQPIDIYIYLYIYIYIYIIKLDEKIQFCNPIINLFQVYKIDLFQMDKI